MAQRRGRGRVGAPPVAAGRGRGRGRAGGGNSVGKFLAPHTGRQAGAIANAQAGAEFNPEIREDRAAAKGSRKREQDLGSWYAQLAADYGQGQQAGLAALTQVQDTTSKQLAEASGRSSADLAKLSADDESFAKLTGGPKDTAGLARIAQAGAAAERSRVALNAPVAQEQANFVARLGGDRAAARMQGIEERRAEQRRRDKIKKDLLAVRKDKGRARVARKEEIRQADRGFSLDRSQQKLSRQEAASAERQAAADAALARIEAAQSARQDAIGNRQAQERIGISRKNARISAKSQRASERNDREENKGGLSPSERRDVRESRQNAAASVKTIVKAEGMPKNAKEWAILESIASEQSGSDPADVRRAVAKLRKAQAERRRRGYERRRRGPNGAPH